MRLDDFYFVYNVSYGLGGYLAAFVIPGTGFGPFGHIVRLTWYLYSYQLNVKVLILERSS